MKVETLLAGLMTHWHCVDCTLLLLLLLVVTLLPILILIFHIYERNMCPLVKILEEIIERHLKIFVMLDDGFLALSIGEGGDALGQMRGTCFAIWPLACCLLAPARLYFHPGTVADVPPMQMCHIFSLFSLFWPGRRLCNICRPHGDAGALTFLCYCQFS